MKALQGFAMVSAVVLGLVVCGAGGGGVARAGQKSAAKKCPGCHGKVATCLVCKKRARLGRRGAYRWFYCECGGVMKRTAEFYKSSHEQKLRAVSASPHFGYPECGHGMPAGTKKAAPKVNTDGGGSILKPAPGPGVAFDTKAAPLDVAIADAQRKADGCAAQVKKLRQQLAQVEAQLRVHRATLDALKKAKAAMPDAGGKKPDKKPGTPGPVDF